MPVTANATRSSESDSSTKAPAPTSSSQTPAPTSSRPSSWMQSAPPAVSLGGSASWTPSVSTSAASGAPLPSTTQTVLERSYQTNFDSVRVHTDSQSQDLTRGLSTRAVTYGNHIFLGPGERPSDLRVMAHEAAHVVQQRSAPTLQQFSDGGNTYESEAEQASAAVLRGEQFAVREQTGGARMQGLLGISIPDPLDWLAGKANIIPGFRMFTIVLGVNPINMSAVDRSPGNILRALIEFIPGGGLITQALDSAGVFEKGAEFVAKQIATLGLVGSSIKSSVTNFIKGLSLPGDLLSPGATWERAKKIFTDPIDRIKNFVKGLVSGIVQLVKDAILKPIAKLAEGTEGYNLLKGILGKDPITGESVTTSAETLLGPLMKMIGLGDVWAKMQQAKAIPRAWQWFQTTKAQLIGFVSQIPGLFIAAFKALTLEDIVLIPKAFAKLSKVFGGFLGKFVSWGVDAMWKLLEIVFDVVSPGAYGYVKKTGAALKSILKNPLPFVGNLVKAAKLGFTRFGGRFVTHLKSGLINWLTGSLPGVYIPRSFSLGEVVKFVFSVLGLTWANVRQKLVKATSESVVVAMETGFDIVKTLVTQGPAAAWDKIQAQLSSLKDQVIQGIIDLVVDAVVTRGVPKLIAMFIPGAGFISAIVSIYDIVMVFVNKISQIIQVVNAFVSSIVAIAAGNIGAAAGKVESILANLLSLAINFLAGFAGLGKIANKIMGIVNKIRAPIDKALDALIAWIVGMAKKLGKFLMQAGVPQDPKERLKLAGRAAIAAARRLSGRITRPVLDGVLAAIRARYGLTQLIPVEKAGIWWVRAVVNPSDEFTTGMPSGLVGPDGRTPAAQYQPAGGGARPTEGPNYLPMIAKLTQAVQMFTLWTKRASTPVGQQMLRGLGLARDQAQALHEDQKRGIAPSILQPRVQAFTTNLRAIQALDPQYELVSIGEMAVTVNNAKRQMPRTPCRVWTMSDPVLQPIYEAQLAAQEAGLNSMTAAQWLANRGSFGVVGRPKMEKTLRRRYGARSGSPKGTAAPHNPDQSLAGFIDPTGEPADSAVNSHIGSQNQRAIPVISAALNNLSPASQIVTQLNFELGVV